MESTPEMDALLRAIRKIDKQVEWREKRIASDQADVNRLAEEREQLSYRYRDLNMQANPDLDG